MARNRKPKESPSGLARAARKLRRDVEALEDRIEAMEKTARRKRSRRDDEDDDDDGDDDDDDDERD